VSRRLGTGACRKSRKSHTIPALLRAWRLRARPGVRPIRFRPIVPSSSCSCRRGATLSPPRIDARAVATRSVRSTGRLFRLTMPVRGGLPPWTGRNLGAESGGGPRAGLRPAFITEEQPPAFRYKRLQH
jgi:hypothetical protein